MAQESPAGETDAVTRPQGKQSLLHGMLKRQHRSLADWSRQSGWEQGAEAEATESTEADALGAKGAQGSRTAEGSRAGLVPRAVKSGA